MPSTVPIPAEIVGDFASIERRLNAADMEVACWADTLVAYSGDGTPDAYCMKQLTEKVMRRRNINAEWRRRRLVAYDLAHADEGNPRQKATA